MVRKGRRISRFSSARQQMVLAAGLGDERGCEVELTEVRAVGQGSELQTAAALVFAHPLPGGVQPGPDESSSYLQCWASSRAPPVTSVPEDCDRRTRRR
jgi:hypothetical protein